MRGSIESVLTSEWESTAILIKQAQEATASARLYIWHIWHIWLENQSPLKNNNALLVINRALLLENKSISL